MSSILPQPFGKYVLLNKIAAGGMAEIFRAKTLGAEGFEKEVVIKRILPFFTQDENFVTMFIDEAKVSSKLTHPNIVQIFDFDNIEGSYYIAMEYVEGKDLKNLMDYGEEKNRPLEIPQIVYITMEVCKGLHYAHSRKSLSIIHRDVSPQNIMISYEGDVKVMDFGIAKATERTTKTQAGMIKGKVAYMSPEQAVGKDLDPRSDLFAVGVVMWEMLTGQRLLAGETDFETLSNVIKRPSPPPSSVNKDVPKELDDLLVRCLSKDRESRHDSCRDFARDLEKWMITNNISQENVDLEPLMQESFENDIETLHELRRTDAQTILEVSEIVRAQKSGSSSSVTVMAPQPAPPPPKKKSGAVKYIVSAIVVGLCLAGHFAYKEYTKPAPPEEKTVVKEVVVEVPRAAEPKPAPVVKTQPVVEAPVVTPEPPKPVEPALAALTFSVVPPGAKLQVNGQEQAQDVPESGIYKVQGFRIGETIKIKVTADKYRSEKDTLRVTTVQLNKTYTLKKIPPPPTGPGTFRFNARPWAKVRVKGKSCVTPCTLRLPSGKHRAVFKQDAVKKVRTIRVQPGKTGSILVRMDR